MGRVGESLGVFLLGVFILALSLNAAAPSQTETIAANDPTGGPVDYATFKDPPREYRGHAWFTFNLGLLNEDRVRSMVQQAVKSDSYGGFMITPSGGAGGKGFGGAAATGGAPVTYLNEEFFKLYKVAIEEGLKNNLPMDVLYDELQFPTGMSGHMDQEEPRNPVGTQGDLMKIFKHQQIPGIDDIWFTGRSNVSYKVIASAAYNYDRPLMMAETYAAYQQDYRTAKWAYRTAMDQHAMGANLQIGGRPGGTANAEMGQYVGRMEYLLRHGRHVADIAVLYPIAALQADYAFAQPVMVEPVTGGGRGRGEPGFYYALEGGVLAPENDYMDLGEMLFRGMRIDFTYLHPEILESKCLIEGNKLILDNQENREEFRVLVVPGGSTISIATARRILDFYRAGGTVIATGKLPTRSAEFKQDKQVQQIVGQPVTATHLTLRPLTSVFYVQE